jgi:hypothetical protein
MSHQLLQCRNPHVFISLMGPKCMSQGMDADLRANARLLDILGTRCKTLFAKYAIN